MDRRDSKHFSFLMLVMTGKFYATCQTRKLSTVSSIHVYQGIKAHNYKKG